jgi:uncharacterized delta-60 repeat protein
MLPGYRQLVRRLALLAALLSCCALLLFAAGCGGKGASSNASGPVKGWGKGGLVRLADFEVSKILDGDSGRVLALGITSDLTGDRLARAQVIRLLPNGSLDSSFGEGGIVRWPYESSIGWLMGSVLPNGRIVLAGATGFGVVGSQSNLVITELDESGHIIKSFGKSGSFTTAPKSCLRGPTGIAAEGDRIVVAVDRFCKDESPQQVLLTRLKPDGTLDKSFGKGGYTTISSAPGSMGLTTPILVLPNKRLAIATATPMASHGLVSIVGLLENGTPNLRFGHRSVASVRVGFDSWGIHPYGLFFGKKGVISLTGSTYVGPFIARFTSGGSPDYFWLGGPMGTEANVENFGGAFGSGPGTSFAKLAQRADGDFVAAGAVLARVKPYGTLDVSYPVKPLFTFDGMHAQYAWDLLVASDGTVLVTTRTGKYATSTLIARYR